MGANSSRDSQYGHRLWEEGRSHHAHQAPRHRLEEARRVIIQECIKNAYPSFPNWAVGVMNEVTRKDTGASFGTREQAFWDRHGGISATPQDLARISASNAAAKMLMDSSAYTASTVAELLGLSASTVRHYRSDRKLYSYLVNGKLLFPTWQFTEKGSKVIPALEEILKTLPEDLHPQSVAGFFLTPQPDLVLHGKPVSAKEWLGAGGSARAVIDLAEGLAAGY